MRDAQNECETKNWLHAVNMSFPIRFLFHAFFTHMEEFQLCTLHDDNCNEINIPTLEQ